MRSTCTAVLLLALAHPAAAAGQAALTPVLGVAGWSPWLLLVAGMLLLAVEVFVIPGFGWSGVIGLLAVIGGVILAISPEPMDAAFAFAVLISSLTLLGIALWSVASRVRAGHPLLGGMLRRDEGYLASLPRPELVGLEGIAVTDLRPAGTAQFGDERLDVVSEAGWIPAGAPVRIEHSEGYRHVVSALALPTPAEETPEEG